MQQTEKGKLGYLEGLRGIAALIVVLGHLRNTFSFYFADEVLVSLKEQTGSYLLAHIVHSVTRTMLNGDLAVYIFWFMSAYVISIKLFVNDDDEYLFKSFSKRYFRLMLPALGSILFAYALLKLGWMHNVHLAQEFGGIYPKGWLGRFYQFEPDIFTAIKTGLWDTFFNYNEATSYNVSLWTMQPELYGSIFCFFLFGVVGRRPHRHIIYLLFMAGAFALGYYWLVSFLVGLLVCDLDHTEPGFMARTLNFLTQNAIINAFVLAGAIVIGGKMNFFGYSDLFTSSIIVLMVMRTRFLRNFLQQKVFIWLGKISFSLYLIHIPLICSFACYLYLKVNLGHQANVLVASTSTIVIALLLAHVYTKFVDKPSVVFSNKFANWLIRKG